MSNVSTHAENPVGQREAGTTTAEAIGAEEKGVAAKVSEAASNVAEKAKDAGNEAATYVRDKYEQLGEQAKHAYDNARETGREWAGTVEGVIQRQPVTSLLIAAGVGVLLGILWKRR